MRALATVAAFFALQSSTHWHAPRWWLPQALCIHRFEGAWDANTGNGFYGGMQFTLTTWRTVGGRGWPNLATPREQLHRAFILWTMHGWRRDWPNTARLCGLR